MFKRRLRCRFDLLHPCDMVGSKVVKAQENQKRHYSNNPRHINLPAETPVLIRNYAAGPK